MSKLNLLLDLKGYEGSNANTCNYSFSKNVQYTGIDTEDETIKEVTVGASSTELLFSVATADAKKFIYLEASGECDIIVNGTTESTLKLVVIGDSTKRGIFLKSTDLEEVSVTNNGTEDIKVYYITAK
jgi:hypothetical protein